MATYTIEVDDALTDGLTAMLPIRQAPDIQTMITDFTVQIANQGKAAIQQNNAQIMANALAQGMTPAQAAALIQ